MSIIDVVSCSTYVHSRNEFFLQLVFDDMSLQMIEPCIIVENCDGSFLPCCCHLAEVLEEGHIITVLGEFLDADDLCFELRYIKYFLENNVVVLFIPSM